MQQTFVIHELTEIVNNYSTFFNVAVSMEWIETKEKHEDWFRNYPTGILMDLHCFPEGYIEQHFKECFVRCILSDIAFYEEWEKDFFPVDEKERSEYLTKGKKLYESYMTFKELRLQIVTSDDLKKEIQFFAKSNEISVLEQKFYYPYIDDAVIIELGGMYSGDYVYIAIKPESMLFVNCGIWD